jgi:hypothetical protein
MVIALPNGRVNRIPRTRGNPAKQPLLRFHGRHGGKAVQIRFIAMLKLLFKFDRP